MISESILKEAAAGNQQAQDSIINQLMPDILKMCRGLSRGNGSHFMELESLGLYMLVNLVRQCKGHPAFDLYVYRSIRGGLLDYLRRERKRKRLNGSDDYLKFTCGPKSGRCTLEEELTDLNLSLYDRKIILMRMDGYTMQEIADEVGCGKTTVYRVIERVKDTYRSRN